MIDRVHLDNLKIIIYSPIGFVTWSCGTTCPVNKYSILVWPCRLIFQYSMGWIYILINFYLFRAEEFFKTFIVNQNKIFFGLWELQVQIFYKKSFFLSKIFQHLDFWFFISVCLFLVPFFDFFSNGVFKFPYSFLTVLATVQNVSGKNPDFEDKNALK